MKLYLGAGATRSEGGFAANKVQSASLLDASVAKDKNGKSYYKCAFTISLPLILQHSGGPCYVQTRWHLHCAACS